MHLGDQPESGWWPGTAREGGSAALGPFDNRDDDGRIRHLFDRGDNGMELAEAERILIG
jgi:hypothetical protein